MALRLGPGHGRHGAPPQALPHARRHLRSAPCRNPCRGLPHATAFNAAEVPELLKPIADALGVEQPGLGLFDYAKSLGAPTTLKELGMPEDGIDRAADLAVANPYWNPRDDRTAADPAAHRKSLSRHPAGPLNGAPARREAVRQNREEHMTRIARRPLLIAALALGLMPLPPRKRRPKPRRSASPSPRATRRPCPGSAS